MRRTILSLLPLLVFCLFSSQALALPQLPSDQDSRSITPSNGSVTPPPAPVGQLLQGEGYSLTLQPDGMLYNIEGSPSGVPDMTLRQTFPGSNPQGKWIEENIGSTQSLNTFPPQVSAPRYQQARYASLYTGIDLVLYKTNGLHEYDFVVAPGADPRQIRMRFDGVSGVEIGVEGDLLLHTSSGVMRHEKPVLFQVIQNRRVPVEGEFRLLTLGEVGFEIGPYDPNYTLVIDPVVRFSTVSADAEADEFRDVARDAQGNLYLVGRTNNDAVVVKLNPQGGVLYRAVFGGDDFDEARAIAVLPNGEAVVAGSTNSNDFPLVNPMDREPINGEGFIARLNANGDALLYSTYFGQNGAERITGLALDGAGNIHIAGTDIFGGSSTGFVAKINPAGSAIIYQAGFGVETTRSTTTEGIALDAAGNAYVTGTTNDLQTIRPLQSERGGDTDAYVAKIGPAGAVLFSTYLGGAGADEGKAVATDGNQVYMTGLTRSHNFPLADPMQGYLAGSHRRGDAFLTRISADGSRLIQSSYLGGYGTDIGQAISVDARGNIHIAGSTRSTNFPTAGPIQPAIAGGSCDDFSGETLCSDAFITTLAPDGRRLLFSTYLGGLNADEAFSVLTTGTSVVAAGKTSSPDFPILPPALAEFGGASDGFVVEILEEGANLTALNLGAPTAGDVTSQTATIRWTTDVPASSRLEYGPTPIMGHRAEGEVGANHSVSLTGLTPGTVYYYRAVSRNEQGAAVSPVQAFFTAPLPAGEIITVAGTGELGYFGDGPGAVSALDAVFGLVGGVSFDPVGNLYIADSFNGRIRRVLLDGTIETVAGNGETGAMGDGGPATEAQLNDPRKVAFDAAGNMYIADYGIRRVRKVTPDGIITTVAGTGNFGFTGDGGPASQANVIPTGVTVDAQGNLYIADYGNERVRKVTPDGIITTVAGGGNNSAKDGLQGTDVWLTATDVTMDKDGNLLIAGSGHVFRLSPQGVITRVAGGGPCCSVQLDQPATQSQLGAIDGIAADSQGNIFLADRYNNQVYAVTPDGILRLAAGGNTVGGFGGDNGPAALARLNAPMGVAVNATGDLFIADQSNYRIRKVFDAGGPGIVAGQPLLPANAIDNRPPALQNPQAVPQVVPAAGGPVRLEVRAVEGGLQAAGQETGGFIPLDILPEGETGVLQVLAEVTAPNGTEAIVRLNLVEGDRSSGVWSGVYIAPANPTTAPQTYRASFTATDYAGNVTEGAETTFTVSAAGTTGPLPPSQRQIVDVAGGPVANGEDDYLHLLIRTTPVAGQPGSTVNVEVLGPTGQSILVFPLELAGGQENFSYTYLGVAPTPGEYTVRFVFPDATLTRTFSSEARSTVRTVPLPRISSPADGSLQVTWDAVPGAKTYAIDLWREEGDSSVWINGALGAEEERSWTLPAGSLQPGGSYFVLFHALDVAHRATPLPETLNGAFSVSPSFSPETTPAVIPGDITGDGRVNVQDATLSLRFAVGLLQPTAAQRLAGDMNKDGRLNVQDTTLILRKAVGLPIPS